MLRSVKHCNKEVLYFPLVLVTPDNQRYGIDVVYLGTVDRVGKLEMQALVDCQPNPPSIVAHSLSSQPSDILSVLKAQQP